MESQDQQQTNHALLVSDDALSNLQDSIAPESLAEGEGGSAQAAESTILPEEVLQKIYKCVLDNSPISRTMLDWRLVCSDWKNSINNYPAVMDNLWWTVTNIPQFLNSSIATKIKNLRFVCGLSADQEQFDTFFKEIIPNVEGIMFDFPEKSTEFEAVEQGKLFTNLISFAKNLEEIKVKSTNRKFLGALLNPEEIELLDGCIITNLFLNCKSLEECEIPVLKKFLSNLPKLCKIVIRTDNCWIQSPSIGGLNPMQAFINNVILPYIQTCPPLLKEMLFENALSSELHEELVLATLKYNLDIDFGKQKLFLNSLFEMAEQANVEINEHNCQSLKNCWLILSNEPALHKCAFFSKLRTLEIVFIRVLDNNELEFLTTGLKHLNTLTLRTTFHPGICIPNPDSMFLAGIPNLRQLVIQDGIFNSYANFGIYFPNLVRFELKILMNLPADIFVSLGQMDKLSDLHIQDCRVTDEMFTAPCQAEGGTTIPAIATIKNLKSLKLMISIGQDHLLTDVCLIDGISHCPSLTSLTLRSYRTCLGPPGPGHQFTDAGFNAIKATGRIKLTLIQS